MRSPSLFLRPVTVSHKSP
uniref:Uncharacterized protein n=1 Tax=Anguilla anguilla TaxID=7936 RepID=A0A0E9S1G7_ANGAN